MMVMKARHRIALLSLARSDYFNIDASMVTTSSNNWGRVQVAACGDSSPDPNWLVRVSPRAVHARPSRDCLAGHDSLDAPNDMAWRLAA